MANLTTIPWTDFTINLGRGCRKVSDGCLFCYSERDDKRWGNDFTTVRLRPQGFKDMLALSRKVGPDDTAKVFLNSMTDTFHDAYDWHYLAEMLTVCAITPNLTYQILTKRAGRMRSFLTDRCRCGAGHGPAVHLRSAMADIARKYAKYRPDVADISGYVYNLPYPLPNVWFGVSAENQHWADVRLPKLAQTPAAVRFVSVEPYIEPLRLHRGHTYCPTHHFNASCPESCTDRIGPDWVIIGGESGFRDQYRPMDPEWIPPLIEDCRAAGAAVFVKQLGTALAREHGLRDFKGENWDEWPSDFADLRIREFPKTPVLA